MNLKHIVTVASLSECDWNCDKGMFETNQSRYVGVRVGFIGVIVTSVHRSLERGIWLTQPHHQST